MQEKHVYDVRGQQSSIFRLENSDPEGLVHMVSYRLAIIFSFLAAIAIIFSIRLSGNPLSPLSETLIILMGLLMTPQLFESMKAAVLIASNGVVFGKLNTSFLNYGVKKHWIYGLYKLFPYIVMIAWIVALVWLGMLWSE